MRSWLLLVAVGCGSATVPPLGANPGEARYADVGAPVTLDGSASTGAVAYEWHLGDGRAPLHDAVVTISYARPGRYQAVLTVFDAGGNRRQAAVVISVTWPPVFTPRQSGSVAVDAASGRVAVVSPDSDELTVIAPAGAGFAIEARYPTSRQPRTVTRWREGWAVACQSGAVDLIPGGTRIDLPRGSRPYGVLAAGDRLYVSLQGTGELAVVSADGVTIVPALPDARGLALLPDGRIAVTRWRSPDERGEIAVAGERWTLAFDPQPASNTESGGVPSWLDQVIVSPNAREAVVPALQADIGQGLFRNGQPLRHDATVRAVLAYVDPLTGVEDFARRKLFDNRGFAAAAAMTSRGDYLYVAMRGNRSVERMDLLIDTQSGSLPGVGLAPAGLALSADDRWLFVDAYLSRELVVYDLQRFADGVPAARLQIPTREPLSPQLLEGKRLFNDAADPRLGRDGYLACAHCHLDGEHDGRTWDFSDRGEGLRNTISLLGRAGGDGPLHWSANFDELQDFEQDLRGPFAGRGLMSDEEWHTGTRREPLGEAKAGVSPALDALAAYVESLDEELPSPFPLDAAAARGRVLFESSGCATCHAGARFTDSRWLAPGVPLLHDVGTLAAGSGRRLGEPLIGLDTPTLRGLWASAPYLHDGSAPTLRSVLARHGGVDSDDLIAYLLTL